MEGACAVKENLDTSEAAHRQFEREAKLLYKLRHPNLPRVFDHFLVEGQGQYLVMDYIEGRDLDALLASSESPLPVDLASGWIAQVCNALSYLHAQEPPIIHRDIKPANIRISPDGQAILVDFGIAKVSEPGMQTSTGARALTPGYAPVEQYGLGRTDARSDIYSLGATLYTALTGQRPVESVQRTIKDGLVPAEQLNPAVPAGISQVICQAMALDPDRRFQDAAQFKSTLEAGLQPQPVLVSPAASEARRAAQAPAAPTLSPSSQPAEKPRRWGVYGGAMLGVILLAGILGTGVLALVLFNRAGETAAAPTDVAALQTEGQESSTQSGDSASTAEPTLDSLKVNDSASTPVNVATSTLFAPGVKPEDIPVMPGAQEVQAFQMNQEQAQPVTQVIFRTEAEDSEIIAFYEQEMPANGWSKSTEYEDANQNILYFMKDNRIAIITISQQYDPTMVGIMVMEQ